MSGTTGYPTFRSPAARMLEAQRVCRLLFEAAPIGLLVLDPELRIVDANDAYLSDVRMRREVLAGMPMFEAFPDNPHDIGANGVRNLGTSFEAVLYTGRADAMPLQRYDVKPEERPWEVRYWYPKNWPVMDDKGSILALVHHVRDVTAEILAERRMRSPPVSTSDLLRRADAAIQESREASAWLSGQLELARAHNQQIPGLKRRR